MYAFPFSSLLKTEKICECREYQAPNMTWVHIWWPCVCFNFRIRFFEPCQTGRHQEG